MNVRLEKQVLSFKLTYQTKQGTKELLGAQKQKQINTHGWLVLLVVKKALGLAAAVAF